MWRLGFRPQARILPKGVTDDVLGSIGRRSRRCRARVESVSPVYTGRSPRTVPRNGGISSRRG